MIRILIAAAFLTGCGGSAVVEVGSRDPGPGAELEVDADTIPVVQEANGDGSAEASTKDAGALVEASTDSASSDADDGYAACKASACAPVDACGSMPTTCAGKPVDCGLCNYEKGFPFTGPAERAGYCDDNPTRANRCGTTCAQIYEKNDPVCGNGDRSFGSCPNSTAVYAWDGSKKVFRAGGTMGCALKGDRWCCPS